MIQFTLSPCLWLDPNILPPFYRRERERRKPVTLALPRYWKKKKTTPTISLLPPSESFRIEKKTIHREDLRGKKESDFAQTFPQTLSEIVSASQLQIRYICGHGYSLATRQIQSLYRLHGWRYTVLWVLAIHLAI